MFWRGTGGETGRFGLRRVTFCAHRKSPKMRKKPRFLDFLPVGKWGVGRTVSKFRIVCRTAPLPLTLQNSSNVWHAPQQPNRYGRAKDIHRRVSRFPATS